MPETKKIFALLLSLMVILGIGLSVKDNMIPPRDENYKSQVTINGFAVNVDIADTAPKQQRGLSGRNKLKDNEGMFFVFETADVQGFWMKDMLFPIDIIWAGEDLRVVSVDKNLSPDTYPATFSSKSPVMYVLEVNSGFSDRNNVKIGDKLIFVR